MKGKLLAGLGFGLTWIVLAGGPTAGNIIFGALLGLGVAAFVPSGARRLSREPFRLRPALRLLLHFPLDVWLSGWRVARLVLSPQLKVRPALFELPLRLRGERTTALLANMITLTPGTLTVDTAPDGLSLVIHALDVADIEEARAEISGSFEELILEAWEGGERRS